MTSEFAVATHALVYLNHTGKPVTSETLAENVCTHPARVRKVIARLKSAGLVATKEGMNGGIFFYKNPEEVNLRQVADALGVTIVGSSWRSGDVDMDCLIASGMAGIMDEIYGALNGLCLRSLEEITIKDLDERIFNSRLSALI